MLSSKKHPQPVILVDENGDTVNLNVTQQVQTALESGVVDGTEKTITFTVGGNEVVLDLSEMFA